MLSEDDHETLAPIDQLVDKAAHDRGRRRRRRLGHLLDILSLSPWR